MDLAAQLEALLFWKAEPVSTGALAKMLEVTENDIRAALEALGGRLTGRGIRLVKNDGQVMLATEPGMSGAIEQLVREEQTRDLGKAGLETLTIVLYCAPISRPDIDYIRGVNSTFILRHLVVRGLVERESGEGRGYLYKPSFDLLNHMGLATVEALPDYASFREKLKNVK